MMMKDYDYTQDRYGEDLTEKEHQLELASKIVKLSKEIVSKQFNNHANYIIMSPAASDAFQEAMININNEQNGNIDFYEEG